MIDPIQSEIDALMHGPGDDPSAQGQQINFIRGPDGQIAGAQIGSKTFLFRRNAQGEIDGLRNTPSPQQIEMSPASNQPQVAMPSPFNGPR
jgi:hypothetical protein